MITSHSTPVLFHFVSSAGVILNNCLITGRAKGAQNGNFLLILTITVIFPFKIEEYLLNFIQYIEKKVI